MKIMVFILLMLLNLPGHVIAIEQYSSKFQKNEASSKPGNYQLGIRNINPIIDPGGKIKFEVFLTGYGNISDCKIGMYTSNSVFDESESQAYYGYQLIGNQQRFGNSSHKIPQVGFLIVLPDLLVSDNKKNFGSIFEDVDGTLQIMSETKQGRAPIEINLKTLKKIQPGNYECDFNLTYFNGVEWKGESRQIQFKVRNILERNEYKTAALAAAAAIISILVPLFYVYRAVRKSLRRSKRHA